MPCFLLILWIEVTKTFKRMWMRSSSNWKQGFGVNLRNICSDQLSHMHSWMGEGVRNFTSCQVFSWCHIQSVILLQSVWLRFGRYFCSGWWENTLRISLGFLSMWFFVMVHFVSYQDWFEVLQVLCNVHTAFCAFTSRNWKFLSIFLIKCFYGCFLVTLMSEWNPVWVKEERVKHNIFVIWKQYSALPAVYRQQNRTQGQNTTNEIWEADRTSYT